MTSVEPKRHAPEELPERLREAIDEIRSVYQPERIILFGSAAQGLPWYDLDLLVVAETDDDVGERWLKLAHAKKTWIPSDVLVFTPDEFQKAIDEDRFFITEEIIKKGKTIYERGRRRDLAALLGR
jgi:predicted nucleotidyltransferase